MLTKCVSIVLCCLLLCSVVLALTACTGEQSEQTLPPITTEALVSDTSVMVYIEPQQLVARAGETVQFEIEVVPREYSISGGEINLRFDSKVIEITDLEPGELFGDSPLVGTKQIDNQTGSLTYALARIGTSYKSSETGTFATIDIRIMDSAKEGTCELSLASIGLSDEVFESIKEIATKGATLEVQQ